MKWTELEVAESNQRYYLELINTAEVKLGELEEAVRMDMTGTERALRADLIRHWEVELEGSYANLAIAYYSQGKLDESREAAKKALPAWREQFLPRLEGVSEAILHIDETDCECMPNVEAHKKFSIELYENVFLLRCVECNRYHARTKLPDELNKVHSIRQALTRNTDITKSIPDNKAI